MIVFMSISEARDACNIQLFRLKFTTNNDGSYREGNIACNVGKIPVPVISDKDNEEIFSTKCNIISIIARILDCTELKHQ